MESKLIRQVFEKASEAYYYGDHITGDLLLGQCIGLVSMLYEVEEKKESVLKALLDIKLVRANNDLTAIADILRYEIAPIFNTAH